MSTPPEPLDTSTRHPVDPPKARDAASWAPLVNRLELGATPVDAMKLNVDGRRVMSPVQGFGRMWQKTYRLRLEGADVTPAEVVSVWKRHFGSFWPRNNWFYGSLEGLKPGDVALLNLHLPLGGILSTGVLVLYADDESFTVMTPEGHQFAGFNTFSAAKDADGTTVAEIRALVRGSDPVYELTLALGIAHRIEDRFWRTTLLNLGAHFGVSGQETTLEHVCIDRHRQWRQWKNVRHNALIRSMLYLASSPVRWVTQRGRRRTRST